MGIIQPPRRDIDAPAAPSGRGRDGKNALRVSVFFACEGLFYVALFFPGTMDRDSGSIATMAANGRYTDWFPPLFIALWRLTSRVGSNPGSFWLLQTGLMLAGVCLTVLSVLRLGRLRLAAAIALCTLTPPFAYLFHEMTKDTFMDAALLCLTGIAAYVSTGKVLGKSAALFAAIASAALALTARYNAIFAVAPLLFLAINGITGMGRNTTGRILAILTIALWVSLSSFTRWELKPLWRPAMTSLITFDLAGITTHTVPPLVVGDDETRAMIDRCYTPKHWDTFAEGECHAFGDGIWQAYTRGTGRWRVLGEWIGAILFHPIAYARHRGDHFMSLLRVSRLAGDEMGMPLDSVAAQDDAMRMRPVALTYEKIAKQFFALVPPWTMLAITICLTAWTTYRATIGGAARDPLVLVALGLSSSAVAYTVAYLIVGVSSQFRYVYWLYLAGLLACVVVPSTVAATDNGNG